MKFIGSLLTLWLICWPLAAKQTQQIKLAGPAAVISYPLMVMAEQQSLADDDISLTFTRWKNPDQLRAMIVGQQTDFSAMPSNLAAVFFNKGHKLKLINISIWDIMSVVSRDPAVKAFADLKNQEIIVPFKNDMPAILLEQLLSNQLGDKKSQIKQRTSHNLLDSSQLLLAGQVDHALLIEPVTSMVMFRNSKSDKKPLYRAINISEQWQSSFPNAAKLPQAGIVANTSVSKDSSLLLKLQKKYHQKALWCKQHANQCASIVKKYLPKAPTPALVEAIKHTELKAINASNAKQDIESFYQVLLNTNAKLIGGKLPTDDFYL